MEDQEKLSDNGMQGWGLIIIIVVVVITALVGIKVLFNL